MTKHKIGEARVCDCAQVQDILEGFRKKFREISFTKHTAFSTTDLTFYMTIDITDRDAAYLDEMLTKLKPYRVDMPH